jgi:plastocyanin
MQKSLFFLLLLAACSDSTTPTPTDGGTSAGGNKVRVVSNSFEPKTLTVKAGTTVEWEWESGIHNVVSGKGCAPDNKFRSGDPVAKPKTFSFKFDTAGTFDYYCDPHCSGGMTGTIIVQ